jgi:iron complex transport system permease protein
VKKQPKYLILLKPLPFLISLAGLALFTQLWAWTAGSVEIPFPQIWRFDNPLITDLRVPRSLNAFAVGGLLAVSGNLIQILLRNPLADPYILGISGGAAGLSLLAILLGLGTAGILGGSFLGAIGTLGLVYFLARANNRLSSERLLLIGVIVASGWGAVISLMMTIASATYLRGMVFWLLGDLSYASSPVFALIALAAGLILTIPLAPSLNIISRGELLAQSVGVSAQRLQIFIYIVSGVLTAVAVTQAGTIGFIGLVVPHILRLMIGNDQKILLPASALLGGSLLTLADTLSRTLIAPQQLPVGAITAVIGVPIFLYLLLKQNSQ